MLDVYLFEVAFVWELTKETVHLPVGCLQGGFCTIDLKPSTLSRPRNKSCARQGRMMEGLAVSPIAERMQRTRKPPSPVNCAAAPEVSKGRLLQDRRTSLAAARAFDEVRQ